MAETLGQSLDLLLRGACLGLLLLLCLRLLQPPRAQSKMLCLGLLLCIAAYLLASSKLHDQLPEAARVPLVLMATVAPALFWLFAQVLFNDAFRWRFYVWLPLLALSVLSLLMEAGGLQRTHIMRIALLQHVLAGLLTAHVLWVIRREQGADLLVQRRTLRLWLGPGVGLYILVVLLVELGHSQSRPPLWLELLNVLGIGLFTLWFSLRLEALLELLAPPLPSTLSSSDAVVTHDPDPAEQAIMQRLHHAMHDQHLWQRESLSVSELASHLGLAEYRLRKLINGALGQRNFNSYLNQFRIEAACAQLSDPSKRRLPILSIALDVGFASIGPFNRAFKAQRGITPSEFRLSKLGEN